MSSPQSLPREEKNPRDPEPAAGESGRIEAIPADGFASDPAEAGGALGAEAVGGARPEKLGALTTEDFRAGSAAGAVKTRPVAAPAPIDAMRNNQLTLIWSQELRSEFGEEKDAAKKIARLVDVNTRTAENWLYGVNTPDLLNALKLMAHVPALAAETRRLIGMSAELDPELERDFQKLLRTFTAIGDRGR